MQPFYLTQNVFHITRIEPELPYELLSAEVKDARSLPNRIYPFKTLCNTLIMHKVNPLYVKPVEYRKTESQVHILSV